MAHLSLLFYLFLILVRWQWGLVLNLEVREEVSFKLKRRAWTKTEVPCRFVGGCVKEVRVVGTPEVGLRDVILSCVVGNHWQTLSTAMACSCPGSKWVDMCRRHRRPGDQFGGCCLVQTKEIVGLHFLLQAYKGLSWQVMKSIFMTFKKMASELDADKLAAAAKVPRGAPDALGLCSRSAGSRAQLSSVQSCQWPVEQWKERIGNAVYWVASVCQHSARSFECFDPL